MSQPVHFQLNGQAAEAQPGWLGLGPHYNA